MKVIKPMEIPIGSWKKEVTCPHCHAVLEVEESDLRKHHGSDVRDGSSCDYCTCCCAECKTWFKVENVPIFRCQKG